MTRGGSTNSIGDTYWDAVRRMLNEITAGAVNPNMLEHWSPYLRSLQTLRRSPTRGGPANRTVLVSRGTGQLFRNGTAARVALEYGCAPEPRRLGFGAARPGGGGVDGKMRME